VVVGIDNCDGPSCILLYYLRISSLFKFVTDQLSDLAFDGCPEPTVIVGDFSKGLGAVGAACAAEAALAEMINEPPVCPERDEGLPEAAEAIIGESQGAPQRIVCSFANGMLLMPSRNGWHIAVGRYKERWDELISVIWDWVKAPSIKDLDKRRGKVVRDLAQRRVHIRSYC
jgi:hypothetical protein